MFVVLLIYVSNISSTYSLGNYGQGKLEGINNIYLQYFSSTPITDSNYYKHLMFYYDSSQQKKDNFMDTFLFLPNTSYKFQGTKSLSNSEITQADWNSYLDDQDKSLSALNSAASEEGKIVNVILSFIMPTSSSENGVIDYYSNGSGLAKNNAAALMIIAETNRMKKYSNLKLVGFYWYFESVRSSSTENDMKFFNKFLHADQSIISNYSSWATIYNFLNDNVKVNNYKTLWIPYIDNYCESGCKNSDSYVSGSDRFRYGYNYGFDFVDLQSGYYFKGNDTTWLNFRQNVSRLDFADSKALELNMGVEVEGDNNSIMDEVSYNRLYDFLVYGTSKKWNKSTNIYYFPGFGNYGISTNSLIRNVYGDLYSYSKGNSVTKKKSYDNWFAKNYVTISKGKSYSITGNVVTSNSSGYQDVDGSELTDGVFSGDAYGTNWVALRNSSNYSIVIDLGKKYSAVSNIDVIFEKGESSGIYLPNSVSAYYSADGSNYTKMGDLNWQDNKDLDISLHNAYLDVNNSVSARYIKINIEPSATNRFIFLSEIVVGRTSKVSLSSSSSNLLVGGGDSSVSISTINAGSLSCNTSNSAVATCSINNNSLIINPGSKVGSATIKVIENTYKRYASLNVVVNTKVSSSKYNIDNSNLYIYTGVDVDNNTILNNISCSYGTGVIESGKYKVKSGTSILASYDLKNFSVSDFKIINKSIYFYGIYTYANFLKKFSTNGVTLAIYNGETKITSGNITSNMVLKILVGNKEVDTFSIVKEYIEFSSGYAVNSNNYINGFKVNDTVSDVKNKILTNGTIIVRNNSNSILTTSSIIGTGNKIEIEMNTGNYSYVVIIKGDLIGNGEIGLGDVSKLYSYLKGKTSLANYFVEAGNVVDNDKDIKINDVAKLFRYVNGKITKL